MILQENNFIPLRNCNVYGENICAVPERLASSHRPLLEQFSCSNTVIDNFFKYTAEESVLDSAYVFIDYERNALAAAASIACSSLQIMDNSHYYDSVPAVEIKYFAVDERYQRLRFSAEREEGYFSDAVLSALIGFIYKFTDDYCAATHILLYSTPDAVHVYERNGFVKLSDSGIMVRHNHFLDGCTPMILPL